MNKSIFLICLLFPSILLSNEPAEIKYQFTQQSIRNYTEIACMEGFITLQDNQKVKKLSLKEIFTLADKCAETTMKEMLDLHSKEVEEKK